MNDQALLGLEKVLTFLPLSGNKVPTLLPDPNRKVLTFLPLPNGKVLTFLPRSNDGAEPTLRPTTPASSAGP